MLRLGREHAEMKFTNLRTGGMLRFRKEMVGGIPTITLSLKELKLSDDENQRLMAFIADKGLKTKWNKSRKFLLLGSSIEDANDIAIAILAEVLGMSKYTRFHVQHEGIVRPTWRR